MFRVLFYIDKNGVSLIQKYIDELEAQGGKDSRVKLNKIRHHIGLLAANGTDLPANVAKHLDGEIWELRPIRGRILFAAAFDDAFVLLHCFMKKSQKTPRREIEQAKRELDDFKARHNED